MNDIVNYWALNGQQLNKQTSANNRSEYLNFDPSLIVKIRKISTIFVRISKTELNLIQSKFTLTVTLRKFPLF